jgi:hypothetical protein
MITNNPNVIAKELCDGLLIFKFKQFETIDNKYNETKVFSICKLLKSSKITNISNIVIDIEQCEIQIPMEFFEFVQ